MSQSIPALSPEGQEAVGQIGGVTGSLLSAMVPYLSSNPGASRCARLAQERYEEASVWATKAIVRHEQTPQVAANDQENLQESIGKALQDNQGSSAGDGPESQGPTGEAVSD